jgi:hypothetical protein
MYTFRTGHGTRAERLASLMNILRTERKQSDVAGRRWRLACFVLGRPSYMAKP